MNEIQAIRRNNQRRCQTEIIRANKEIQRMQRSIREKREQLKEASDEH